MTLDEYSQKLVNQFKSNFIDTIAEYEATLQLHIITPDILNHHNKSDKNYSTNEYKIELAKLIKTTYLDMKKNPVNIINDRLELAVLKFFNQTKEEQKEMRKDKITFLKKNYLASIHQLANTKSKFIDQQDQITSNQNLKYLKTVKQTKIKEDDIDQIITNLFYNKTIMHNLNQLCTRIYETGDVSVLDIQELANKYDIKENNIQQKSWKQIMKNIFSFKNNYRPKK